VLELDRLLSLVRRELGAMQADIVGEAQEGGPRREDEYELRCRLSDGRSVVARFDQPPSDRDTKLRRLEMLAASFDELLNEGDPNRSRRRPIAQVLQGELEALRSRAAAINAVVIDANSPIVWGAAAPSGLATTWPSAGSTGPEILAPEDGSSIPAVSRAAIDTLRGLSETAASRKGKHVRHVERGGDVPFLAHSFAGIYLLLLVFDSPFDELRAERAILDSLPRIERLVLALPPLDPSPVAGARAMARPRRR
jgi:hypothetical protein